jgi:hypothetical protein
MRLVKPKSGIGVRGMGRKHEEAAGIAAIAKVVEKDPRWGAL